MVKNGLPLFLSVWLTVIWICIGILVLGSLFQARVLSSGLRVYIDGVEHRLKF